MRKRIAQLLIRGLTLWEREGARVLFRRVAEKLARRIRPASRATASPAVSGSAVNGFALCDQAAGVWLIVEHPTEDTVQVPAGVLSFRGWAWSRAGGAGKLSLRVRAGEQQRDVPVRHRYQRADVSQAIADIPRDNDAGFEVSIDRFDLPAASTVELVFENPSGIYCSKPFAVTVGYDNGIVDPQPVPCDCCGGTDLEPVGKKDGLTLSRCRNCGLVFTSPRPDMTRVYQRYSEEYFAREYLPEIQGKLSELRTHWDNILDSMERYQACSHDLFEVGIGAGYLLERAARRGWRVSGIDLNAAAVNYARGQGLDVLQGDIHKVELPRERYGAIILESTLEHFLSPRAVLEKCAQALVPGGGCFIWTLGYEGDIFLTQGMDFNYVGPSEHLYYFSTSSLARLCESVGLRVDRFWRDSTYDSVVAVATKRHDRWD